MNKYIIEEKRDIQVVEEVDVCIVGGSCTGLFAAIRASRLGAKVCIVEKSNCFGGSATTSFVNGWTSIKDFDNEKYIISGLTMEVINRLRERDAVYDNPVTDLCAFRFNTEDLKLVLDDLSAKEDIITYFHTMYCSVHTDGNNVDAIIIENKDGRQAIKAKFFIDASGDGDVARDLKLPCYRNAHMQPPTPGFRIYGDLKGINIGELIHNHGKEFGLREDWGWSGIVPNQEGVSFMAQTHVFDVDCSKAKDLSAGEIEGRRQIKAVFDVVRKYHRRGKSLSPSAICSQIGIRDTTHYETIYKLKGEDMLSGKHYEDTIAYGTYPIDIHNDDSAGITFRYLNGLEKFEPNYVDEPQIRRWRTGDDYARYYEIPFRVLVQDKYSNFIPVGRMINADEIAFGAVRVMVNLNQLGEAAGVAAYLSIKQNKAVLDIDSDDIRETMKNGGSIML